MEQFALLDATFHKHFKHSQRVLGDIM
jgi:hypothetical protein